MTTKRSLRQKAHPVSYEISSDDENTDSQVDSSFSTPQNLPHKRISVVDLESSESEETEPPKKTPPPRSSAAGHSLRQRSDLKLSLQARENADKRVRKKRRARKQKSRHIINVERPNAIVLPQSARNELRDYVNTVTAAKRANFFIAKRDFFLPLLPEGNHIQKLIAERGAQPPEDIVEYKIIEKQPHGVEAVMKPYQMLGLSYLVYLFKNGISGILGDEMGLGKTLQTLSLFQYLKENREERSSSLESQPCLVVCPLSVLSSWIAESRKWTPGLKVLRFHGSIDERNRLKRVATGEIDQYGHQTLKSRKKKMDRLTATGKPILDLDSDLENGSEDQGVDLIVTTYEGYLAEQGWFKKAFVWSYVVLDEGHKIKNDLSLISKALQGLGAEYRLILTGTPLQNNLQELWALLHWLYPEIFTEKTADLFKESFNLTKGKVSTTVMDDARRLLEIIMLRRMKNSPGVELNLPPKTEVLLYVPLTPIQRFWYERLLTRADQNLLEEIFQGADKKEALAIQEEAESADQEASILKNKTIEDLEALDTTALGAEDAVNWEESKQIMRQTLAQENTEVKDPAWKKLMNLLMQLRKCCNHPYILPHAEPDPYDIGEHIVQTSSKFIVLDKIIRELVINEKKKVLIFSGFTRMLDYCEDFLALRGGNGEEFKYVRLDGGTTRARRNLSMRMFNNEDTNYRVMLISTRAGGLGINLATASDVIFMDQDWNPQIMLQAEARAHRIGQTKPVTVYKLCTQGTVEEQMMGRIRKKLYLSAKVTESMRDIHFESSQKTKKGPGGKVTETSEADMPQLDTNQLMSLVRRGAQTLAHPELDINDMIGWDWPTMLEKCKDKPADVRVHDQTQTGNAVKEEDEKRWLSQIEQVESRVFRGKKHTKGREANSNDGIAQEWSREQRRVGKNTTVIIDGHVVSKESASCGDWEAVPTLAGKDPRLAEPKREGKAKVVNQDCADCEQNTTNAGGMIYRCRWCERGYCEDCLDWDKTDLLGENLKEYELLGFPAVSQAFYIKCSNCHDHHEEEAEARDFCIRTALSIDKEYAKFEHEQDILAASPGAVKKPTAPSTPAQSMTDATTLDTSGLNTPDSEGVKRSPETSSRKRKAAPTTFGFDGVFQESLSRESTQKRKAIKVALAPSKTPPTKRSKRISSRLL
ncbi:hypothetical protein ACLMJK_003458 [Lecanora helva]